ncbi:hypothetical protein E2562_015636 [Oryza meyeriana var. granulata]|uniref:Uncharacterized protein n=1 Tax=Oryza meyeriana var. granulata TaxID=110450 RepID=A0A6G1EJI6_9ORYZ|nr:hypothetical protein E2562_015636 [Oryza meyeriana var. granulata]
MVSSSQKKPVGGGAAGSRVAELEAKLGKAEGQLAEMREQLTAAEKSRKDARAALVEAKKRFSVKKRDVASAATSSPVVGGEAPNGQAAEHTQKVGSDEKLGVISSAGAAAPGDGHTQVEETKNTADDDEENSVAAIAEDLEWNNGSKEVDELRTKLMAKDTELYELKAKLMAMDAEADDLRANLATKDRELDELRAKLMAKDADIAAVEGDNAELMNMAEEASQAVKETAMKARETEHALRESAAREARLAERLRASERVREALEAEMQRARAQSEQWRKAAEEAAAVLGGGLEHGAGARAVVDVEKRRNGSAAGAGERMAKDADEHQGSGGGKRKARASGGAMWMLSDLWKKKGQK